MRAMVAACLALSSGCAYVPHDQQQYANRSSVVFISGFVSFPDTPVEIYVQGWKNLGACAQVGGTSYWQLLGTAQSASKPRT